MQSHEIASGRSLADLPGMDVPAVRETVYVLPWFRRVSAAWVLLAVMVLGWDLTAADDQTLSEAFRRCKDHPQARPVVAVPSVCLTARLSGLLPRRAGSLHAVYVIRWKGVVRSHECAGV